MLFLVIKYIYNIVNNKSTNTYNINNDSKEDLNNLFDKCITPKAAVRKKLNKEFADNVDELVTKELYKEVDDCLEKTTKKLTMLLDDKPEIYC